jgi:hypothetical protein
MHPTAAFAAPCGFVGWTIPSPSAEGACRLVSTPSSRRAWLGLRLGSGLPCRLAQASPNLAGHHLRITPQAALDDKPHQGYDAVMIKESNCIICGTALEGKQTMFCSITCKNKHHQSYAAQKGRGLARKLELVKSAGGHCSICGYDRNLAALAFHHIDSEEKDFKLDMRSLSNRTLNSVLTELDKCILVCHNCHAELHNPHLDFNLLL